MVNNNHQTKSELFETRFLFRNLYRDFLKESYELLKSEELKKAYEDYLKIAELWKKVAELFHQAGKTEKIKYIDQASKILIELSELEKLAMENLLKSTEN
jgi:poly-D-alanine transfer protein DltD